MRIVASDFYVLHRTSECERRVFLRHRGEEAAPAGPYEQILRGLGDRHESKHLESLGEALDLAGGDGPSRADRTRDAVAAGQAVIYQGVLIAEAIIGGVPCVLRGDPDFMLETESGYVIRDCKLALRVTEGDHPEILRQLELYGWLYEKTFGAPPARIEVLNGRGEIVELEYDGGARALEDLERIVDVRSLDSEPREPVGWTKCGPCPYRGLCWDRAVAERDVAILPGVDQSLARALYDAGIESIEDLLKQFDAESLGEFTKQRGAKEVRVGAAAEAIFQSAASIADGQEQVIAEPDLPHHESLVMFDLEGLPAHLDELEQIFLWGTQVFGDRPSAFHGALAGSGPQGDQQGWIDFLSHAGEIFDEYGDIPFVHWHHYERVKINLYVDRYGDRDGVAARVLDNLLDLLPIVQASVVLPLPSYSLKLVEKYVGYTRQIPEGRGDWAMARYIESCEIEDEVERAKVIQEVMDYNREDLEATWAVFVWLRRRGV